MYIEKNVCESIIGPLLDTPRKTKYNLASRLDLVEMRVRSELAPQFSEKQPYFPTACYNLKKNMRKVKYGRLQQISKFHMAILRIYVIWFQLNI